MQKILIKIKELEYLYDIDIVPCWTTRSDLNLTSADFGSKLGINVEEYGLAHHNLVDIQNFFHIEIQLDAFASFKSKRSERYFSPIPQYNCEGIDFFCQKLDCNIVYYMHPPIKMLSLVFNRLKLSTNIRALMILPIWLSRPFWTSFVQNDCFHPIVKNFYIFDPEFVAFSKTASFKGHVKFKMLAFYIHSGNVFKVHCPLNLDN